MLLLTAEAKNVDRIVGLEIGADDYLPKPFNPRELLAHATILRRNNGSEPASEGLVAAHRLAVAGLELDTGSRSLQYKGVSLSLTDIEFALLEALMQAPGQVLTESTW